MPHRVIVDPAGATWQVWAVHPTARHGVRTRALLAAARPVERRLERRPDGGRPAA